MSTDQANQIAENTDKELWREREGDYYSDSIHVTKFGGIGINCGGLVHVRSLSEWHKLAEHSDNTKRVDGKGMNTQARSQRSGIRNQIAEESATKCYAAIQDDNDIRPTLEILNDHFKSAIEKAETLWAWKSVRCAFVERMESELAANGSKGSWREWLPPGWELMRELNYHCGKLVWAMAQDDPDAVSEFAADLANLAMKADEVLGASIHSEQAIDAAMSQTRGGEKQEGK